MNNYLLDTAIALTSLQLNVNAHLVKYETDDTPFQINHTQILAIVQSYYAELEKLNNQL
jgi:hypothetical protein